MTILSAITLTAPVMLAGASLIALPILAHLMNKRARRVVVFPSIQLLKVAAANQSSFFKLRRWWLLLLRCLTVLAVVLAFAQPLWLGPSAQATGGSGLAVVILIDRSASTGQQYAGVSAVHSIRARAARVLDGMTPGRDRANIVYATARPYMAFHELTSNTEALRSELDALEPTSDRADLVGAIAMAGQLLEEHRGPRRLVILSDLQASNWQDAMEGTPPGDMLPAGTIVSVPAPAQAPPGNFALHGPASTPVSPSAGQIARLSVSVTNHDDRAEAVSVGLEINGREVDRKPVRVEGHATVEAVFDWMSDGAEFTRVQFTLPGDGLAVDDRCYLSLSKAKRSDVAVITDDDVDQPGTAGYFLIRALAPYGDERDTLEVNRYHSAQISWDGLNNVSAVVIGEVGVLTADNITALRRYMQAGGGVIYVCGRGAVPENLSVLHPGEAESQHWLPEAPIPKNQPLTITGGDWRSPLLKPFDEMGREALSGIPIRLAWAGTPHQDRGNGWTDTLLWYPDETPALARQVLGTGQLVMVNLGLRAEDSDLGKHGLFVALMQGLVEDLQPTDGARPHTVGELVYQTIIRTFNKSGPAPITERPDGKPMRDVTLSIHEDGPTINIDAPAHPGFYRTRQGSEPIALTAVNIDPRESDLRRVSADTLHGQFTANGVTVDAPATHAGPTAKLHGSTLWGWLLLGAMTCLALEMLLLGAYRS